MQFLQYISLLIKIRKQSNTFTTIFFLNSFKFKNFQFISIRNPSVIQNNHAVSRNFLTQYTLLFSFLYAKKIQQSRTLPI